MYQLEKVRQLWKYNFESRKEVELKKMKSKNIKFDLSRFAYKFNAETLLENLDSQDETSEELPDQLLPFWE